MNYNAIATISVLLFAALGFQDAAAQSACGVIYPSPTALPDPEPSPVPQPLSLASSSSAGLAGDPCLDGSTVFGPMRFEKTRWLPRPESATFELEAAGDVCILSESSGYGSPAKARPFLSLDGELIAGPLHYIDLNDQQIHELAAGTHEIGTLVFGLRGAWFDVEARQIIPGDDDGGGDDGGGGDDFPGLPMPGEVQIDPETGALDMVNSDGTVRLQNVGTDHPLVTPNGDGDNDTTTFTALVTPLEFLPGKDDGTTDYFLEWSVQLVDLNGCGTIDLGLTGTTQINSPTSVNVIWSGVDGAGLPVPDGNYGYVFVCAVVDEFGTIFGTITSPAFGLIVDGAAETTDYTELAPWNPNCNPTTDPTACRCPGVDGQPGAPDPFCTYVSMLNVLPEFVGIAGNYLDPSAVDLSFITTTQDPVTGRYTVVVDLRDHAGGGLIPKDGFSLWTDEHAVRLWVAAMTGVPLSTGDSLFNFDYVQIGTSTAVDSGGHSLSTFNHFLMDALLDSSGIIFVGGAFTSFDSTFNTDTLAPAQYQLAAARAGDECSNSANTDGTNTVSAKFCAYNNATPITPFSDLGVYMLRTTVFDIEYNDAMTTQDQHTVFTSTGFETFIRNWRVPADTIEIESTYYDENAALTRTKTTQANDTVGLSVAVDRGNGEDGVCSRAVVIRGGLAVRMDSADGSVPDTCIINGIF